MSVTDTHPQREDGSVVAATPVLPIPEILSSLTQLHRILDQGTLSPTAQATWGDISVLQAYYERLLADHSALQAENEEKTKEIERQQRAGAQVLKEQQLEHANAIEGLQKEVRDLKEEISLMRVFQEQELRSQALLDSAFEKSRSQYETTISELKDAHCETEGKLERACKEVSDRKDERAAILKEYGVYVTDAEREFTEFRAELESAYDTMEKEKNESALALQSYMKAATESKDTLNQAWQSQHTKLGQEHQTLKSEKEAAENTALQRKAELEVSHKSSEERAIRYESEKGALKTRLQEAEDGKRKLTDDLAETQAGLSAARLTIETKEREKETARIKSERRVSELAQEISNLKKASADLVQQQQLDKTSREGLERRLESYQAWDALSPGRLLKQDPLKSRRR